MKKLAVLIGLILCFGSFTACSSSSGAKAEIKENTQIESQVENNDTKSDSTKVSLSDWESMHPVWNSITSFYDEDYLQLEAKSHAEKENSTVEAIIQEHEKSAHSKIETMEFSGEKIILKDKDGNVLASSEYGYVKTIGEGEEHGEFAVFEAKEDVPEEFKALALMEPHGGEGDITHFHVRYGKSVDDEVLADENWWPVFVDPASTKEQVINEILGDEH